MTSGDPKLVLKPGHLEDPDARSDFEGEADIEFGPTGRALKVSADGLDKTIELLKEVAKTEPDITPMILGVTFLKGLATTDAEGRLVWDIVATADGDVTVNGALMPKGP